MRKALEVIGEQTVKLDAKDMSTNADASDGTLLVHNYPSYVDLNLVKRPWRS